MITEMVKIENSLKDYNLTMHKKYCNYTFHYMRKSD